MNSGVSPRIGRWGSLAWVGTKIPFRGGGLNPVLFPGLARKPERWFVGEPKREESFFWENLTIGGFPLVGNSPPFYSTNSQKTQVINLHQLGFPGKPPKRRETNWSPIFFKPPGPIFRKEISVLKGNLPLGPYGSLEDSIARSAGPSPLGGNTLGQTGVIITP